MQVVDHEKWGQIAMRQHTTVVHEPAKRGTIFATPVKRKGFSCEPVALAFDVPVYHLMVDTTLLSEEWKEKLFSYLAIRLGWDEKGRLTAKNELAKHSKSRKLATSLPKDSKLLIEKEWKQMCKEALHLYPAIYFVHDFYRSHPFGSMAGQILHTVRRQKDPLTHACIPTGGLEMRFDHLLRGKDGQRRVYRTPRHLLDAKEQIIPSCDGKDLYLTIDPFVQAICEEELCSGIKKAGAKSGFAICMEAETGKILGLAHYPFFEIDHYPDYFSSEEEIKKTQASSVISLFEPGSILKSVTVAIAFLANLEREQKGKKPLFSPAEIVETSARLFPGRSKVLKDVTQLRYMDLSLAMQKSSNVYMATIVDRIIETMGASWYRKKLADIFGLGEITGVQIPGELPGFLPSLGKCYAAGQLEWSKSTPYSLAIGYNTMLTGMQMARIYAMLANGGYKVKPTLFVDEVSREPVPSLDPRIAGQVKNLMRLVTKKGGSAQLADVYGYTEAGKTSTTEKLINGTYSKDLHTTLFAGIAPLTGPSLVIVVAMDEPSAVYLPGLGKRHYGGKSAAPIFRKIAQRALNFLAIPCDDPGGYPQGDPRYNPEIADGVKEAEMLYKRMMELNYR